MKHSRRGPSPALQDFGRRLEASYGIEPLRPGERRPDDYYFVNHYTGRNTCPPGTVGLTGKSSSLLAIAETLGVALSVRLSGSDLSRDAAS